MRTVRRPVPKVEVASSRQERVLVDHQVVVCGVVGSEWLGLVNLTIKCLLKWF